MWFKMNHKKLSQGFTLLEILVASVILFSSIAAISLVYRGALLSAEKANAHVTISGVIPNVLGQIRQNIRSKGDLQVTELKGLAESWGVKYRWTALQTLFKAAPATLDFENVGYTVPPNKYKLWNVSVTLEFKGVEKNYEFQEMSWNES